MSVSFKAIIDVMENLAPLTLKEDWDNPGLLVGNPKQEVQSVLLTLDVTKENYATLYIMVLIVLSVITP